MIRLPEEIERVLAKEDPSSELCRFVDEMQMAIALFVLGLQAMKPDNGFLANEEFAVYEYTEGDFLFVQRSRILLRNEKMQPIHYIRFVEETAQRLNYPEKMIFTPDKGLIVNYTSDIYANIQELGNNSVRCSLSTTVPANALFDAQLAKRVVVAQSMLAGMLVRADL